MLEDEKQHVSADDGHVGGMFQTHGSEDAVPPAKRGPGRPKGSPNRPKAPPMSSVEREALRRSLGPAYVDALMIQMRAGLKAKGLKSLIVSKLGHEDLAAIEADVIVEVENGMHNEPEAEHA